jgi:hypothetical protein
MEDVTTNVTPEGHLQLSAVSSPFKLQQLNAAECYNKHCTHFILP